MAAHKGHDGQGGGRPKGSPNKATQELRMAFKNLLDMNTPNMIGWLETVAAENPAKALDICSNMAEFIIPKLARQENTGLNGGPIEVKDATISDKEIIKRYLTQQTGQTK